MVITRVPLFRMYEPTCIQCNCWAYPVADWRYWSTSLLFVDKLPQFSHMGDSWRNMPQLQTWTVFTGYKLKKYARSSKVTPFNQVDYQYLSYNIFKYSWSFSNKCANRPSATKQQLNHFYPINLRMNKRLWIMWFKWSKLYNHWFYTKYKSWKPFQEFRQAPFNL